MEVKFNKYGCLSMISIKIPRESYLAKDVRFVDCFFLMLKKLLCMRTCTQIGQNKRIELNFGIRELDMSIIGNSKTCNDMRL